MEVIWASLCQLVWEERFFFSDNVYIVGVLADCLYDWAMCGRARFAVVGRVNPNTCLTDAPMTHD